MGLAHDQPAVQQVCPLWHSLTSPTTDDITRGVNLLCVFLQIAIPAFRCIPPATITEYVEQDLVLSGVPFPR